MADYRRLKIPGATYFFTVVTFMRKPIFSEEISREILRNAIDETNKLLPFQLDAWVLLPDHLHCLWTLPEGDRDFSKRWGIIKSHFTKKIKEVGWALPTMTNRDQVGWALPTMTNPDRIELTLRAQDQVMPSRVKHREGMIWQRRFWEHAIRDQEDFNRHCDYIHYNPVKHGLADDPKKWKYSTIHQFIERGVYAPNWGDSVGEEILSMDFE